MAPAARLAIIVLVVAALGMLAYMAMVVRRRLVASGSQARLTGAMPTEAVSPAEMLELQQALGARLAEDARRLPEHEIELVRHALWTAMLLEAGADDNIDAAEIDFVTRFYGQVLPGQTVRHMVADAGHSVRSDRESALRDISKAASVSLSSKRHILQGAFLVTIANDVLEPSEARWLHEIAVALGLSAAEQTVLFQELPGILKR